MEKPIDINQEKKTVTVPMSDGPQILIMDQGNARLIELHSYGEVIVKTHDGRVSQVFSTKSVRGAEFFT